MALETGTYISDLNPSNPVGATDKVSTLDDHVRLIKATLQNTFPNIDGAVSATEDELNHLDGVTGTTGTGKLVLDASPTIADLTVTSSITLPAASIADSALSDNVALLDKAAAFESTLSVAGAATFSSTVAVTGNATIGGNLTLTGTLNSISVADFARKSQPNTFTADNTFSGEVWLSSGTPRIWLQETDAGPDNGLWHIQASGGVLSIGVRTDAFAADNVFAVTRSGGTVGTVTIGGDVRASRISTSTSTTLAAGQIHVVTGNSTLPNMAAGQWVTVINNSASPITVTKNASDTMYWTASGSSVTSVTIPARGRASFVCADGTNVYASGNITGAS